MQDIKTLVSGIKPTGDLHIGNYFGAIKPMVDFAQTIPECFIFVADLHALTSVQNKKELSEGIIQIAASYIACGLDPNKITLFKQSDVSAHTELAWIFDCITTMPYLMRAHAYKDSEAKNKEINVGVFNYPMLMASDILLYDAEVVPVGTDQKQHVEYARDTALKFNRIFGDTFILPEAHITEGVGTVPGLDGKKMSKSYKNVIPLFGSDEDIKKTTMSIVTDSKGADEAKVPETCNIFALHKLVSTKEELEHLEKQYREGKISYKESKELLSSKLISYFSPMREKYNDLMSNREKVIEILRNGGEKANKKAQGKMKKVRELIGVHQ